MRLTRTLLMVLVLGVLTFVPTLAFAADATFFGPIIPAECHCENSAPDWGCVVQVIQNGINFTVSMAIIVFTLMIAYAGAMYMASAANPKQHSDAIKMAQNVVLGLLVLLSAWLLVDFVMKVLYDAKGSGFGPWEAILADGDVRMCLEPITERPQAPGTGGPSTPQDSFAAAIAALASCEITVAPEDEACVRENSEANGDVTVCFNGLTDAQRQCLDDAAEEPEEEPITSVQGCPNCVPVTGVPRKGEGTSCGSGAGCNVNGGCDPETSPPLETPVTQCMINSGLLTDLQSVRTNLSWQITEMWPPTVDHTNTCHGNGTCVDVAIRTENPTPAQIAEFARAFTGTRPVFETLSCSLRDSVRSLGISAYCRSDRGYEHITGNHFSIYR